MMKSKILILAGLMSLGLAPQGALAQSEDARIKELERRLDEMSTKMNQMQSAPSHGAAEAPAPMPAMGSGMNMNMMNASSPGVPFHGFADVGAGFKSKAPSGNGFTTGTFDMYLAPQFTDRVRGLFEALIEFDSKTGEAGIDLERAQIGYAFSDKFTLWGGRFHTPFGYYNTAFHHGQLMQTSILKPRFLDFEDKGGIMPSHSVGMWATGTFSLGTNKLGYDVFMANSPSIVDGTLDMNNVGSRNNAASRGINVYHLSHEGALRIGGHYYNARVTDNAVPFNETRMSFIGPYFVFDDGVWEAMYEYYGFRNENLVSNTGAPEGQKNNSYAWFAQLGRRFGSWMPYGRFEKTSLNQDDNYFALQESGRSYRRFVTGLRYDVNPRAAVTVEVNRTEQDVAAFPDFNELRFQYAIGF